MSRLFKLSVPAAVALACLGSPAQASEAWVGTATKMADVAGARPGRAMPVDEMIRVGVALHIRHQPEMDALTDAIGTGRAQGRLSSARFMSHYAPSAAQVDAVVAHIRAAGFTDITVARNRMLVSATGNATAVAAAFDTGLSRFEVDGREVHANTSDVRVPARLSGIVSAVLGLQDVRSARVMSRPRASAPGPLDDGHTSHLPTSFPTIYDADGLPPATESTIGIIAVGDIRDSLDDLDYFAVNAGFAVPPKRVVIADRPGKDTSARSEWNIDSQSSLSMAGGAVASMNFYVASTFGDVPLVTAYLAAVIDDTAQVVNISLGECELDARRTGMQAAADAIFQVGMAMGQVFTVASGDSGSFNCNGKKLAGGSYPAVSPFVMAVGGTTLLTTADFGSIYLGESLWSCSDVQSCGWGGSGGGLSSTEKAPRWQVESGLLGSKTMRNTPDVVFDGDPSTGIIITYAGGGAGYYGGTSLAAPIFAGAWARLQSLHHNTLDHPAAVLYQAGQTARGAKSLHDIIDGGNGGYECGAGWDEASGFGSIDVGRLSRQITLHARTRRTAGSGLPDLQNPSVAPFGLRGSE